MSEPSFLTSLVSGGMAGMAVDISLFPLDTVKTRLQSKYGLPLVQTILTSDWLRLSSPIIVGQAGVLGGGRLQEHLLWPGPRRRGLGSQRRDLLLHVRHGQEGGRHPAGLPGAG